MTERRPPRCLIAELCDVPNDRIAFRGGDELGDPDRRVLSEDGALA